MEKDVSRLWKKNTVELGLLEKTKADQCKIGKLLCSLPESCLGGT